MMFGVVEEKVPTEKFMAIIKIPDGKAGTIANAIDKELTALDLNYENTIAFGFDGASNMAGNNGGMRKKLSEKANKAHILSLAAASCRNKNQKVKRFFHVLKDIYKLFRKSPKNFSWLSPKKENILHDIQAVINDPVLTIPECIEVRMVILDIAKQREDNNSFLQKNIKCKIAEIKLEACLIEDESVKSILAGMKKYCESVIKEIEGRFNAKSIEIMLFASRFDTFQSMSGLQDKEVINFCNNSFHSQCRSCTCGFEIFYIFHKVCG